MAREPAIRRNLTAEIIDGLEPREDGKPYRVYDAKVQSLAVLVSKAGKSLGVYRSWKGKPFSKAICKWNDGVGVADARKIAGKINSQLAENQNPHEKTKAEREGMTLKDAFEHYIQNARDNKRRSCDYIEKRFNLHLKPLLNRPLVSITTFDLSSVISKLAREGKKTTANRVRSLVSTLYNYSIRHLEYQGRNVAQSVFRYEEKSREIFLGEDEIKRFLKECDSEGEPYASLFKVALNTGMRISNCIKAEFKELDLEARIWRIPAEKSKTGKAITIPLNQGAVDAFNVRLALKTKNETYVFPHFGRNGKANHMAYPKHAWKRILKRANLSGIFIHSLRHTFISKVVQKHGIYVGMRLAAHEDINTTKIYSHANLEDLRTAVDSAINF